MNKIYIPPIDWKLRQYQIPLWKSAVEEGRNVCAVWHRRQQVPEKMRFC